MNQEIEIWKPVVGYEGLYEVSNLGRVKGLRKRTNRILKFFIQNNGYCKISLSKDGERHTNIHRVVAMAFIPNPENKPQVNHKNGIKTDNRVENLEWVTSRENMVHSIESGLRNTPDGESHYNCKLSDSQAIFARNLILDKIAYNREIAAIFGVDRKTIEDIVHKKTRKYLV